MRENGTGVSQAGGNRLKPVGGWLVQFNSCSAVRAGCVSLDVREGTLNDTHNGRAEAIAGDVVGEAVDRVRE